MSDPNIVAAKGGESNVLEYNATLRLGMLPIVAQSTHPTIIYRWNIRNVVAPAATPTISRRNKEPIQRWTTSIWIDAWVWSLFYLRQAKGLFTNAWTTVQENKPQILELKIAYDEALADPERQLIILSEFRLRIPDNIAPTAEDMMVSVDIAIRALQRELDEKERANGTARD